MSQLRNAAQKAHKRTKELDKAIDEIRLNSRFEMARVVFDYIFGPDHRDGATELVYNGVPCFWLQDDEMAFTYPEDGLHFHLLLPCPKCGQWIEIGTVYDLASLGRLLEAAEQPNACIFDHYECKAKGVKS